MKKIFVLLALIVFIPVHKLSAQTNDSVLSFKIESLVETTMRKHQIPGIAVGVVKDGKIIYARGFGVKKLGGSEPVTTQTIFHQASVTKLFTATAIMQFVERGNISLDDKVTKYLPYFKLKDERYKEVTIRQLLAHTSGIPFVEENPFELKPQYDAEALERHVRALSNLSLSFAPGEQTEYSNYGFDTLGDVVAKVSGSSYEDYVRQNIFAPLGMKNSSLLIREVSTELLQSPHYADETGKVSVADRYPYTREFAPSADLQSSVEDMLRFSIANLAQGESNKKSILKSSTYKMLWQKPSNITTDEGSFMLGKKITLGWWNWNYKGHFLVGHGGADLGFNSFMLLAPDYKSGVVVMGNLYPTKENYLPTGQYYVTEIAKNVMQFLLPANQTAQFDYLDVRGNTVRTTHKVPLILTVDKSYKFLGEFHHQPIYADKQFNVSLAAFAKGDAAILVHAETHTDNSGGLDYTNLTPTTLGKINLNFREQCATTAEIPDPYVNPELQFLRDKGFAVTLPLYLRQYFTTAPDGTAEVVITYGKRVSSCADTTITSEFKTQIDRKVRSLLKIAKRK